MVDLLVDKMQQDSIYTNTRFAGFVDQCKISSSIKLQKRQKSPFPLPCLSNKSHDF